MDEPTRPSSVDCSDAAGVIAEVVGDAGVGPGPIGVTGPVAVGKSHLAAALAERWGVAGVPAAVVCTDSWLLPEAELAAAGLTFRKGFPESYDVDAMRAAFEAAIADGVLRSPRYSHLRYDIEPGVTDEVEVGERWVVEGLHLTRFLGDLVPFIVHLDADDELLEAWYVDRLRELAGRARAGEPSFYGFLADSSPDAVDEFARQCWYGINVPNKVDHIDPWRERADLVVRLGPDHAVTALLCENRQKP